MRLVSWNVNGVRAAVKKGLLDWLDHERPDILAFRRPRLTPISSHQRYYKIMDIRPIGTRVNDVATVVSRHFARKNRYMFRKVLGSRSMTEKGVCS